MRLARGGGEACIDWDAEAGTGGGIHSEHPPPSPEEEVWRGGAGALEWETGPLSSETQERGMGRGSQSLQAGRKVGDGELRNPGEVWHRQAGGVGIMPSG